MSQRFGISRETKRNPVTVTFYNNIIYEKKQIHFPITSQIFMDQAQQEISKCLLVEVHRKQTGIFLETTIFVKLARPGICFLNSDFDLAAFWVDGTSQGQLLPQQSTNTLAAAFPRNNEFVDESRELRIQSGSRSCKINKSNRRSMGYCEQK